MTKRPDARIKCSKGTQVTIRLDKPPDIPLSRLQRAVGLRSRIAGIGFVVLTVVFLVLSLYTQYIVFEVDGVFSFLAAMILLLADPHRRVKARVMDAVVATADEMASQLVGSVGGGSRFVYWGRTVPGITLVKAGEDPRIQAGLIPPGRGLASLFLRETGLTELTMESLSNLLPGVLADNFALAGSVKMRATSDTVEFSLRQPSLPSICTGPPGVGCPVAELPGDHSVRSAEESGRGRIVHQGRSGRHRNNRPEASSRSRNEWPDGCVAHRFGRQNAYPRTHRRDPVLLRHRPVVVGPDDDFRPIAPGSWVRPLRAGSGAEAESVEGGKSDLHTQRVLGRPPSGLLGSSLRRRILLPIHGLVALGFAVPLRRGLCGGQDWSQDPACALLAPANTGALRTPARSRVHLRGSRDGHGGAGILAVDRLVPGVEGQADASADRDDCGCFGRVVLPCLVRGSHLRRVARSG